MEKDVFELEKMCKTYQQNIREIDQDSRENKGANEEQKYEILA